MSPFPTSLARFFAVFSTCFGPQSEKAFTLLDSVPKSRKALVRLTAEEGASLHDQPVGPQVAEEIVFDWLDEQLT